MAKKDERNLNVTIKNDSDDRDEVVISFSGILRKLKKYFIPWIMAAAIAAVAVMGVSTITTLHSKPPLTALISFTHDGIERGLAPDGRTFDVNSVKNPAVIEDTITELGMDMELLEAIRENITVEGIIPSDAIDRITHYKNVYENAASGNLSAAQAMLDVTYYPTQYKVHFDYNDAELDRDDAVQILNAMLENYRDFFFEKYGYNESLGTAVPAVDYAYYDYAESLDVFSTTLSTLQSYVKQIADKDSTRFRSTVTGYTFDDLYQAIRTVKSIDIDRLSSYITVNNLTKDKAASIAYYQYRIESLTRQKDQLSESLNSIKESIEAYEKDAIIVFGEGADGRDTTFNQASEAYDNLILRKVSVSSELAETKQQINFYVTRKQALEKNPAGSKEKAEKLEADLEILNEKVKQLVELTNQTADEYYENVEFGNAYNILVPAVNSSGATIKSIVKSGLMPVIIVEALLLVIYFAVAMVAAIKEENSKKEAADGGCSCSGDGGDDDDDDDDIVEEIVEAVEKAAEKPANKNKKK